MSSAPVMSIALARHLVAAHETLHVEGMRAAAALEGNPFEIEVRRFGRASAAISRKVPLVEWYNRVVGLEHLDARTLREILAFYRAHGIRGRFEIGPAELTSALAVTLASERVGLERFESLLYAPIDARVAPPSSAVEVRPSPLSELDHYLEIWARGFALPEFLWPDVKRIRAAWFTVPEFHRYVALADGAPVACSALYVHGDVGYLCMSATLPEARGRGAQSALIAQRVADAGKLGCTFVVVETAEATPAKPAPSYRNTTRLGFQVAYLRPNFVKVLREA